MTTVTNGKATELITFTRGTLATVTDADGKIKWAPHNLLTNSESFDASSWSNVALLAFGSGSSSNTAISPLGSRTGDYIREQAGSARHFVYANFATIVGANYTVRVFAKSGERSVVSLGIRGTDGVTGYAGVFNLSTGALTATNTTGSPTNVSIAPAVSVGNGWYLLSVSIDVTSTTTFIEIGISNSETPTFFAGMPTYNGDGTSGLYLWGAHAYRSDLGGMQANTSAYPMYNPTTPKNLLGFSEDFSAAAWVVAGSGTAAVGVKTPKFGTAPDGTQTACRVQLDVSAGSAGNQSQMYAPYTTTSGSTYLRSVWIKTNDGSTKTIMGLSASGASPNTVTVTGEWTRFSSTRTSSGSADNFQIILVKGTTSDTADLLVWHPQASDSASLDAYVPSYGAAPTSAAYYGPRRDFDPVTLACKGLLVEEARANLMINSNAPTMGTGLSSTAGAATSPDGTMSAVRVAKTDATTPRYFSSSTIMTTAGGRKYVISRYFKYDGYDVDVSLEYNSTANWDLSWSAIFAVASTGVTVKSDNNTVSSVQNVGNGWYRAITTFTAGAAPSVTANPAILTRVTGASGASVLVYGGMVEENASFATSYIPTAAATVTRNADVASVSTQAFPFSDTAGTYVVAFDTLSAAATMLGNQSGPSAAIAYSNASLVITYNGSTAANVANAYTIGATTKAAVAYDGTGRAVCVNAGTVGTASGVMQSVSEVRLGGSAFTGTALNGHVRQVTYLPRRLTSSELQTRTAA